MAVSEATPDPALKTCLECGEPMQNVAPEGEQPLWVCLNGHTLAAASDLPESWHTFTQAKQTYHQDAAAVAVTQAVEDAVLGVVYLLSDGGLVIADRTAILDRVDEEVVGALTRLEQRGMIASTGT